MSFKVIQGHRFGTNQKPVLDFLLENNTNLHPVSRHF